MKVALILPARNEEDCIEAVIREATAYFHGTVIVVDNGSTDATAERAISAGATVVPEPVAGYGRACMTGVAAAADCDIFVFMDADGSDCPADIPALLAEIERGAAIALGVRTGNSVEAGAITRPARFGNWLSGTLIGLWSGRRLRDLSPLKAIRRSALSQIGPSEMTYGWTVELLAVAASKQMTMAEVPTGYRHRLGGQSKVSGTLSGSFRAGCRILLVLGRVFVKSLSPATLGGAAGTVAALVLLTAYSAWLFSHGPSSRDVLVSSWLLAWPAILVCLLLGMVLGSGVSRNGRRGN